MGVSGRLLQQLGSVLLLLAVQQTVALYNQHLGCSQQGRFCQTLPRHKRYLTAQDCIDANCCFNRNPPPNRPWCYEKVGSSPYFNEHVTVPPNAGNPLAGTFRQSGGSPGYPGNMLVQRCPVGLYPKQPCTYDYPYPTKQQCKKWYCCWDYYYARCFKATFHITKLRKKCPPGTKNPPRCDGCDAPPGLPEYGLTEPTITTIQSQAGPPYIMGTKASYTCRSGYYLDPEDGILTCDASANWSPPQIRCIPGCAEPPPQPQNGLTGPIISTTQPHSGAPYTHGTTATYTCADGHYTYPENGVLTCDTSGNWTPSQITCTLGCGELPARPTNGASGPDITTTQTIAGPPYFVGSTAMYTCNAQHYSNPENGELTCDPSGNWIPNDITCTLGCNDPPGRPTNGASGPDITTTQTIAGPPYFVGSTAMYTCNAQHYSNPENGELTCDPSGNWIPNDITCTLGCGNPPSRPIYGASGPDFTTTQTIAGPPYFVGSTAMYTCVAQHYSNPSDGELVCDSSGKWIPDDITCTLADEVVCERTTQTVTCPAGYYINVVNAFYGRQDATSCGGNPNTNCFAASSPGIIRAKCQGQNSCVLNPSNAVFGDPCRGVVKYIEMIYECIAGTVIETFACERTPETVTCPMGNYINVINAFYGRQDATSCVPNPNTNCLASSSPGLIKAKCQGQNSCILNPSNAVFGDPCGRVPKYIQMIYECIAGTVIQNVVCERASETVTCPVGNFINVINAFYGRQDATSCVPNPNTNCLASSSPGIIRNTCLGQTSCVLVANNAGFGDPCGRVPKYIQMMHECTASQTIRNIVCEGSPQTVSCPSGYYINIINAFYGRQDATSCGGNPNTNCFAASSPGIIGDNCQCQNSCVLNPSNSVFGDPCGGVVKYIEILYECIAFP